MSAATSLRSVYAAAPGPAATRAPPVDARPTLLVTTVDIGEGRAGRIEVCVGDDPVDVARAFCARHGLPEAIVLPLAQHLEENLADSAAAAAALSPDARSTGGDHGGEWETEEGARRGSVAAEAAAPAQGRPSSAARPGSARPGSAASGRQQAAADEPSWGRSDSRTQPPAAAAADDATAYEPPLTYRPACATSSHGAQYFSARSGGSPGADDGALGEGLGYRAGGGEGVPAHARLYADHFRKQQRLEEERRLRDLEIQLKTEQVHIAPASCKLAGHRSAGVGQYRNYGERLYVEGRLDAMRREQLAARVKEEAAAAELEGATFRPEISKLAQQIKAAELGAPTYERLYQRGSGTTAKRQVGIGGLTTAERMEAIRREQEAAEVRECSFRPAINPRSARMVEQRQRILRESGLPSYEQLYADDQRRRSKLQQLAARPPEEATFHPQVNTSSVVLRKLMEGRAEGEGPLGVAASADVATRLLDRGRKYAEKLAAAQRQAAEAPRDAATGRPLFQPKTHRAPHWERNREGAPIGEYLHGIKAEWDEKAARLREAGERRTDQDAASTYVNRRSEKLVDRLKRERFAAIHDYLRRGGAGRAVDLLQVVQDEEFMDTIDPEVRADVEFAARLLARTIQRRQAAEAEHLQDCATSAPTATATTATTATGGAPSSSSARSSSVAAHSCSRSAHSGAPASSAPGQLDSAAFVALMEEVVARTKGLSRQYLLPMPSGRPKFEEPPFRPAIDKRSLALAARARPPSLPAHELLYRSAEAVAAKRELLRRAAEAEKLKECSFHPTMVSAPAKEGRAMKLTAELTQSKRGTSEDAEAASAAQGAGAAGAAGGASAAASGGPSLSFNALERQINEALVRLSLTEEEATERLRSARGAAPAPVPAPAPAPSAQQQRLQATLAGAAAPTQSLDANGYQLDLHALLGSPSPDDLAELGSGGAPHTGSSSLAGFNPLGDASDQDAVLGVAWAADSQEVVAHLVPAHSNAATLAASEMVSALSAQPEGFEELDGLDLQALACAGLPAAQQAETETETRPGGGGDGSEAGAAGPPRGESSGSGADDEYVTPRETLGSPAPPPSARAT